MSASHSLGLQGPQQTPAIFSTLLTTFAEPVSPLAMVFEALIYKSNLKRTKVVKVLMEVVDLLADLRSTRRELYKVIYPK